jgi:hypothetical protein
MALVRHLAKVDREYGVSSLDRSKPKAFELNRLCPARSWRTHILLGGLSALVSLPAGLTPFTGGNEAKMSRDDISRDAPMTVEERRLLRAWLFALCRLVRPLGTSAAKY